MVLATAGYCHLPAVQATLEHTTGTPTPVQTATSNTYFTCDTGYISTGSVTSPYYTCYGDQPNQGQWSYVTYSCERTLICVLNSYRLTNDAINHKQEISHAEYCNCTVL